MSESINCAALLEQTREIGREHPFMDFHVHPFDVITGDINYLESNSTRGLFSKGSACYRPPSFDIEADFSCGSNHPNQTSERALLLAARFAYAHTGPKVFTEQLDLVGLSSALLLPLVRTPGTAENMLETTGRMFSKADRFFLSCPYPVGVARDELLDFFRRARNTWGVRAIKIHSNLIGLDPAACPNLEFMEATLTAANSLNLAIVLHGGRTPGLKTTDERDAGTLEHLAQVNWGISSAPVVFAHAGCYDLTEEEIPEALKVLGKLFEKYPNTMADLSNLGQATIQKVLTSVDSARLIYGSDALYVPIWKAWLQFLNTLRLTSPNFENDLIQIASSNPLRCLSLCREDTQM